MAEESGEKTEMPTPKKLRDGRKKGQVCTSKDVVSTALLVVLLAVLGVLGVVMTDDFSELLAFIGQNTGHAESGIGQASWLTTLLVCKHTFIVALTAFVIAITANLCQVGFLITFEPLKPDLKKINPAEGAKKIFCMKNLFEFFKNVLKVTFLGYLIYKIIWASIPELLTMCYGTIDDIFPSLKLMMKRLAYYTELEDRKATILKSIADQDKLTEELEAKIRKEEETEE